MNQMKENDMMDTHSEEEDKSKEQEKSSTSGILEGLNAAEKALASTKEVRQALSSVFSSSAYQKYWDTLRETAVSMSSITAELSAAIRTLADRLTDGILELSVPGLSEEEKKRKIQNYSQWGTFGWTLFPDMPLTYFSDAPDTLAEANTQMQPFCDAWDLIEHAEQLRRYNISQIDLDSAIVCYQSQQYKACALLLFGIIDSQLISIQPKPKGNKKRPSGCGAVKVISQHLKKQEEEQTLYHLLQSKNLLHCLETLFAPGKDFADEPEVLNRNFISHGMNHRPVEKNDCIQLFVALQNLLFHLSAFQKWLHTPETQE